MTDPARLAALGRIFGMHPADPNAARVLEIGCGAGSNLLAMAARLPGSRFLGLDFAGPDIASGNALAAEAALDNVELRQQDLLFSTAPTARCPRRWRTRATFARKSGACGKRRKTSCCTTTWR